MTEARADRIDRLARRFAGGGLRSDTPVPEASGETRFDRSSLLRTGALGLLAVGLGKVPTARAAPSEVAAGCVGGSLKACTGTIEKNFKKYVRSICDVLKDNKGDPFGTASYSCYVAFMQTRLQERNNCRKNCPKPKSPGAGSPGGGGGGGTAPPGGGGRTPTCGFVDCVQGDSCCPLKGGGQICCAVCCAKNGDGCGSSSSDC
jgi:hypothetical protein